MDFNKLQSQVEKVLDDYGCEYGEAGVQSLIAVYQNSKQKLREILSKHPNWRDDAQAVIFDYTEERECNFKLFKDLCYELDDLVWTKDDYLFESPLHKFVLNKALMNFVNNSSTVISEDDVSDIMYEADHRGVELKGLRAGQKKTKVIGKIFDTIKSPDASGEVLKRYYQIYAKLADSMSPYKVTKTTVLSIHPCDFLNMSNGTGWRSCHNLDGGEYRGGTISYMLDEVSMIFYTIDSSYDGYEFWDQEKINRQVFCYNDGMLLQSRIYPQNETDDFKIDQFRFLVEGVFAECLGMPNLWVRSKSYNKLMEKVETHSESAHYPDYRYRDFGATVMRLKDKSWDDIDKMVIGSPRICLTCGESFSYNDEQYLHCDRCGNGDGYTCAHCGRYIYEDDVHLIDGDVYCDNCVFWCDYHEQYELESNDYVYVEGYGNVCDDALYDSGDFDSCYQCGGWYHVDSGHYIDGNFVCDDCIKGLSICDHCGSLMVEEYKSNVVNESGVEQRLTLCGDCHNELEECSICGAKYFYEDGHLLNEEVVCAVCYDEYQEDTENEEAV